jgi:hypothetical protein
LADFYTRPVCEERTFTTKLPTAHQQIARTHEQSASARACLAPGQLVWIVTLEPPPKESPLDLAHLPDERAARQPGLANRRVWSRAGMVKRRGTPDVSLQTMRHCRHGQPIPLRAVRQPPCSACQMPVTCIGWIQVVVATRRLLADWSKSSNASAGVLQASVFRGRALRATIVGFLIAYWMFIVSM